MKLVELKRRLVPGAKLRLVHSLLGPCDKARVVAGSDTVKVWFTGDGIESGRFSYLNWPKAAALRAADDGFEIFEEGEVSARYRFEPAEPRRATPEVRKDMAKHAPCVPGCRGWNVAWRASTGFRVELCERCGGSLGVEAEDLLGLPEVKAEMARTRTLIALVNGRKPRVRRASSGRGRKHGPANRAGPRN